MSMYHNAEVELIKAIRQKLNNHGAEAEIIKHTWQKINHSWQILILIFNHRKQKIKNPINQSIQNCL